MYADDTVLTISSNTISNLTKIAEFELRKVQKWYMKFNNSHKPKVYFLTKGPTLNKTKISFDDYCISSNKYVKSLSVLLDNQLS